ncbi:MAG: hypothetical protein KatS3mg114_0513 [Planctomycetaceae bacterium]|nr:MAG: hypothetical protein KatS3mg114_0513 [Planctomycetaceae bacterium]
MSITDRPRVLLIDDDPVFRGTIQALLRSHYFVAVAAHGREALRKALLHPPAAVLLDAGLPAGEFLQVVKAFRADPVLRPVKWLMLLDQASPNLQAQLARAGFKHSVVKSQIEPQAFLDILQKLIPAVHVSTTAAACPAAVPVQHSVPLPNLSKGDTVVSRPANLTAVVATPSQMGIDQQTLLDGWL